MVMKRGWKPALRAVSSNALQLEDCIKRGSVRGLCSGWCHAVSSLVTGLMGERAELLDLRVLAGWQGQPDVSESRTSIHNNLNTWEKGSKKKSMGLFGMRKCQVLHPCKTHR